MVLFFFLFFSKKKYNQKWMGKGHGFGRVWGWDNVIYNIFNDSVFSSTYFSEFLLYSLVDGDNPEFNIDTNKRKELRSKPKKKETRK